MELEILEHLFKSLDRHSPLVLVVARPEKCFGCETLLGQPLLELDKSQFFTREACLLLLSRLKILPVLDDILFKLLDGEASSEVRLDLDDLPFNMDHLHEVDCLLRLVLVELVHGVELQHAVHQGCLQVTVHLLLAR